MKPMHCWWVVFLTLFYYSANAQYMQVGPDTLGQTLFNAAQVNRYLQKRTHQLQELARKETRKTKQTLQKLARKEQRLYGSLPKKDSLLARNMQHGTTFDSLNRMGWDSLATNKLKQYRSGVSPIDSIQRIAAFAQQQASNIPGAENITAWSGNNAALNRLQQQLDYNAWLQKQIQLRKQQLLQSATNIAGTRGLLKGIDKQTYYYNQKIKGWKAIASDPDALEQKALDYLKGMKGFEESLSGRGLASTSGNNGGVSDLSRSYGMQGAKPEDLEKMGFQTRSQVNKSIDQKFGLSQNPDALKSVNEKLQSNTQQFTQYRNQVTNLKKQTTGLRNIEKPSFKVNPMRGLPWKQRLEKGITWQVKPATNIQPSILDLGAQVGFKHTPSLTYSIGLGGAIGLGRNWYNMRLSYEGISARASVDWKWIWGISGQAGYERRYKDYTNTYISGKDSEIPGQVITQTLHYKETVYLGLQKRYKLNKNLQGAMLIGYDIIQQQWVFRLAALK